MTPSDIANVQRTFEQVVPISDVAAGLFYGRLFEIAPEVKPLFRNDMTEQGKKLMATLAFAVRGLHDLDRILPAARTLAQAHVNYGVRREHYAPVGAALIWTLEGGLKNDFTPEVKQAWISAYTDLSGAMMAAAYPAEEA